MLRGVLQGQRRDRQVHQVVKRLRNFSELLFPEQGVALFGRLAAQVRQRLLLALLLDEAHHVLVVGQPVLHRLEHELAALAVHVQAHVHELGQNLVGRLVLLDHAV